jgi:hypothetical protein
MHRQLRFRKAWPPLLYNPATRFIGKQHTRARAVAMPPAVRENSGRLGHGKGVRDDI